jgi:hypothetical protein
MAGYSKGIVDTRKLNENSKAKLGRRGDTEIREVDGKKSHVNALEAYLIDVNGKAGEEYTKRVGAGTTNPYTGMPEYPPVGTGGSGYSGSGGGYGYNSPLNNPSGIINPDTANPTVSSSSGPQQLDYNELINMTDEQREGYLGTWGLDAQDIGYIGSFETKPFEFLQDTQALAKDAATDIYQDTVGGLGRTATRGLRQAGAASALATSKSGLATSGTITEAYQTQQRDISQDYTAGTQSAASAYDLAIKGANLAYESGAYSEQESQMDEFYDDIMAIKQYKQGQDTGGGNSCFIGSAPVLMSDGGTKKVEDIIKGDKVIGWGNKIHTVVELRPEKLGNRDLYGFNGGAAFFTQEHPMMTIDGWKSLDPKMTKEENPMLELDRLQVGDVAMIAKYFKEGLTYTPREISKFNTEEADPDTDVYNIHMSDGISFHVYNISFHSIQSGVVVDKYAEDGLNNLSIDDKQKFVQAFTTIPGLLEATGKAFGSTFTKIFTNLGV